MLKAKLASLEASLAEKEKEISNLKSRLENYSLPSISDSTFPPLDFDSIIASSNYNFDDFARKYKIGVIS